MSSLSISSYSDNWYLFSFPNLKDFFISIDQGGEQFVMMRGTVLMQKLPVDNLDLAPKEMHGNMPVLVKAQDQYGWITYDVLVLRKD